MHVRSRPGLQGPARDRRPELEEEILLVRLATLGGATIQRGMRPRPVQVFSGFLGSRYLTARCPYGFAEQVVYVEAVLLGDIDQTLAQGAALRNFASRFSGARSWIPIGQFR